jgi:hypothetical protein
MAAAVPVLARILPNLMRSKSFFSMFANPFSKGSDGPSTPSPLIMIGGAILGILMFIGIIIIASNPKMGAGWVLFIFPGLVVSGYLLFIYFTVYKPRMKQEASSV